MSLVYKLQNKKMEHNMNDSRLYQKQSKPLGRKIKKTIAQICAVSGPDLLLLLCGMSIGYLTILIPELYQKDAEVIVSTDELTWISSVSYFIEPLGALVTGPSIDRLGRKPIMYLATFSFILGWLLLCQWATSAWALLLALALVGFAHGISNPSSHTYLSEVTEVRYRGVMLTTLSLALKLGIFLQLLIGNYLNWRGCCIVNAAISVVALVAIFFVPDSPLWLVKQGRLPETKRSLEWLRGWSDSNSVRLEYDWLVLSFSKSSEQVSSFGRFVQSFFRREVLLPFSMLTFSFFLSCFNGGNALLTYSVLVYEKIESPINEYDAAITTGALQVLAMVILIFAVRRTGKRMPALGSLFLSGMAFLAVSVYTYLRERNIIQQDSAHSWIPITLVLLAIFACAAGMQCSTWIIASELFPVEVKGISVSILSSFFSLCGALANKSFLYMLDGLTLPGMFAFYASINLVGLGVLYRAMPETEGKTALEIEQIYQKKNGMED